MVSRLRSWWQKIKQHPFITVGIVVVILAIIAFIFAVHNFGWGWTGFTSGESQTITISTSKGTTTAEVVQPPKTLWDWLGLLAVFAIPVVVGIGVAWFTMKQAQVSDRENTDNQRETALQAYIDKMSELLLKEHLGELEPEPAEGTPVEQKREVKPEYEKARMIARVRTITILYQLDARRIEYVFAFLREAGLMSNQPNGSIVSLSQASLRKINFSQANLYKADLSDAFLVEANLTGARLYGANLTGAFLVEANLTRANLREANLTRANLNRANLSGANLSGAYLEGALFVTTEQLEQAASLKGATMPDGKVHS